MDCVALRRISRRLLIAAVTMLSARAAPAASLTGSVHYGGSLGPVSAARPLAVLVSNQPDLGGNQSVAIVPTNDSMFNVSVGLGTYYVAAFLDLRNVGVPIVGEPYAIYHDRFTLPADPITVPDAGVSGLALDIDDAHLLSGIAGTVTYTGHLGDVSRSSRLVVFAYTDAGLTMWSGLQSNSKTNGGPYEFVTLDTKSYYLLAFFDLNGNRMPDTGEPFELSNGRGELPGDPVMANPMQLDVNFTFGDEHLLPVPSSGATATVSPTPTVTLAVGSPTPIPSGCVGDCDGDGTVSINELIKGINIALNQFAVSACPAFDCHHNAQVTVDCLIRAVSAALIGCGA